ncbi:MAG: NAD-dependent epimerase [Flammeovirgaceae bacterium]|nr:NAD-dependent epimerase [Flammeovirgaceae bacterium]
MGKILITGSMGLVGSEAAKVFMDKGYEVAGIDNNMRKYFFGKDGDVSNTIFGRPTDEYIHYWEDIRNQEKVEEIIQRENPVLVIHSAAQPSHDWAATEPLTDFDINARGTLILLEACRKYCPDAVFIYVSTNKVYGDSPNNISYVENATRFEPSTLEMMKGYSEGIDESMSIPTLEMMKGYSEGIDESMSIDYSMHSLFGVSKLAGDMLTQEYGRYFGLKTGVFRCGCVTGRNHASAELHGFLAYMAKCKREGRRYKVFGYKGKQVRDNIHASDLARAFHHFYMTPKCGEVYNMGGGTHSNISVLEALRRFYLEYDYIDTPRKGDHRWYISNVNKFKKDYPSWFYRYNMNDIIGELQTQ